MKYVLIIFAIYVLTVAWFGATSYQVACDDAFVRRREAIAAQNQPSVGNGLQSAEYSRAVLAAAQAYLQQADQDVGKYCLVK